MGQKGGSGVRGLGPLLGKGPLVADGGTGTSLVERGVSLGECFEWRNLTDPDLVATVHQAFVDAGARLVETNTFGANRFKLARHGLADRVAELNRAGVELGRVTGAPVAGSVGPLGVYLAPYGRVQPAEAFATYAEQIAALAEAGADLIAIETQTDLTEAEQALAAARDTCDLPVLVSMTFTRDDRILLGATAAHVGERLAAAGADAIGVNCSQGPAQVLRLIETLRSVVGEVPLVARPNAGGPAAVGGRLLYPATPEYFAEYARALAAAGVRLVGGCCGTGPAHIAAMGQALAGAAGSKRADAPVVDVLPPARSDPGMGTGTEPTRFAAALHAGRLAIAVEMDPPRSASPARLLAGAETLADAGADVITVADSPMARMRMSPWGACRLIQEHVGVETVLHFPTRGRNILRIQGDLLATHTLGIRNVFVCMGDPTSIGDHPEAASNIDVAPSALIALISRCFNAGVDQGGASIGEATSFLTGCALNLAAPDLERECRVLRRKIEAGADFALTQPVYDRAVLHDFRAAYEVEHGPLTLPLLVGVLPLVSARHAEFLHNEVPGVDIPAALRDRIRRAADRAAAEGARIATDLALALARDAAGLYLMPPFDRYGLAAEIVDAVRAVQPTPTIRH